MQQHKCMCKYPCDSQIPWVYPHGGGAESHGNSAVLIRKRYTNFQEGLLLYIPTSSGYGSLAFPVLWGWGTPDSHPDQSEMESPYTLASISLKAKGIEHCFIAVGHWCFFWELCLSVYLLKGQFVWYLTFLCSKMCGFFSSQRSSL